MPTPAATLARIERALPKIIETFETPCYVYDETGLMERGLELMRAMHDVSNYFGFQQFSAVKAWNNPENFELQHDMGFGFD